GSSKGTGARMRRPDRSAGDRRTRFTLPPNPGVPGFGNHELVDIGNIRCRRRGRVGSAHRALTGWGESVSPPPGSRLPTLADLPPPGGGGSLPRVPHNPNNWVLTHA